MFDFAWSEIVLIGVVALIAIGPKDMPAALKAVAGVVKKARRMAAEFQTHVDEMMREADLHEVRQQIDEIRNFDIRGEVERTVDADGSLRATFASNPLEEPAKPAVTPAPGMAAAGIGTATADLPKNFTLERPADPVEVADAAPDFVPPSSAPVTVEAEDAPAFVPPGTHRA
jgi:sec-independent protein translocase protein TatB